MSVGTKIKELRIKKGYTQEEMAEKVYISRPYYTNIERGVKIPNVILAGEIADVLGVTVDTFLEK